MEKIKYLFTDNGFNIREINEIDGIRLDFENGFCHIRSSNTEPVIRVIYEAQDKNTIEKIEDLIPDLKNICK
jgi:phosphomannomutase